MLRLILFLPLRVAGLAADMIFGRPDETHYVSRTAPAAPPPTIF